jgi:hypothetical protein
MRYRLVAEREDKDDSSGDGDGTGPKGSDTSE